MITATSSQSDFERQVEFDFLRATEIAALNTLQWLGKGQKEKADEAACDAIRGMLDMVDIQGEVVIGEGIKDEAPGLFKGEKVGSWKDGAPRYEIALDPVDGTTNVSKGMPNSLSCIAAAAQSGDGEPCLQDIPAFYMKKLAYPLAVRRAWMKDQSLPIHIDAPIEEVIDVTARVLGKEVRDVVLCVLDRERNQDLIDAIRRKGAALRMIMDGDISAAMAPAMHTSNIDLYAGIGGAPEAVLSAAGLRCLGGGMRAKIWPRDDAERQSLIQEGWGGKLDQGIHVPRSCARRESGFHRHRHQQRPAAARRGSQRIDRDDPLRDHARAQRHDPVCGGPPQSRTQNNPPPFHTRGTPALTK